MPYYHVTYDRHLPSIRKHGLGGKLVERNWEECDPGVYLATDPVWGLMILIDRMMEIMPDHTSPKAFIESMRIIVVDDSRLDPRLLVEDPSFPEKIDIRLYQGVVDVTAMPVLALEDVLPQGA